MKDCNEIAAEVFRQRDRHRARKNLLSGFFWCVRKLFLIGMLLVCVGLIAVITYLFAVSCGLRQDDYQVFQRIPGVQLVDNVQKQSDLPGAAIDQPLYRDGLRITLKQAIREGSRISLLLDLESTEDFPLESCFPRNAQSMNSIQFKKVRLEDAQGDGLWLVRPLLTPLPDLDGRENTLRLALQYDVSASEGNRKFQLEQDANMVLRLQDLRFYDYRHVLEEKNETLDGYHMIAGGEWKFEFPFSFIRSTEQELLAEAISIPCYLADGNTVDAEVSSVRMSPLGLHLACSLPKEEAAGSGNFGVIKCVLRDESVLYIKPETNLQLHTSGSAGPGRAGYRCTYRFDPPFLADEIVQLYLGGVQLIAEEES